MNGLIVLLCLSCLACATSAGIIPSKVAPVTAVSIADIQDTDSTDPNLGQVTLKPVNPWAQLSGLPAVGDLPQFPIPAMPKVPGGTPPPQTQTGAPSTIATTVV